MSFLINYITNEQKFEKLILPYRCLYLFGSLLTVISFVLLFFENEEKFDYGENNNNNNNNTNKFNINNKKKEFKKVNIEVKSKG